MGFRRNAKTPMVRLQDIPPRAARFCLNIERFCREELRISLAGQSLVVAYSGGADSAALVFVLYFLSARLGLTLHAAILDHGFRAEAVEEVAHARKRAARLGIGFHTQARDVTALAREKGLGFEEAGRVAREVFLETVRKETNSDWIVTGHQLNDLAEDSFMRMVRGAGWPALGGMAGVVSEKRLLRPLLLTPRTAIEAFLADIDQTWHHDRMNEDETFLRNRVRKHMMPFFLRENPSFLNGVAERWRMARADADLFTALTEEISVSERAEGVFLPRCVLVSVPPACRLRKYMEILDRLGKGQVTAAHLRSLDAAWQRNEGGALVQFPGGKSARIREGGILFQGLDARPEFPGSRIDTSSG